MTELIERLTVPVTILGVGAQARLSGAYGGSGKVDPIARRFVRAVLDRGPSIGVRGERTREYLRGLGFGDDVVRVVGCPSMFMFGPDLPALRPAGAITGGSITGGSITGGSITGGSITGGSITGGSRIALTVSPYVARMGPISLTFAERYPGLVYVAQNRETLSLLLTGQYPLPDREAEQRSTGVPISLDHPLLASGRTVFCLDPKSWFAELATYDLCFGSRIHGAIAALLAGTPAVVLAHDARTLELAEYHEIPFREIPADPAQADPARLAAESDWSGSALRAPRPLGDLRRLPDRARSATRLRRERRPWRCLRRPAGPHGLPAAGATTDRPDRQAALRPPPLRHASWPGPQAPRPIADGFVV